MYCINDTYKCFGLKIPIYQYNTIVIGSGAAGLNAADSLYALGVRDVAIVTEGISNGTSRNAGSDKQTYYKLTLGGGDDDSVGRMARTLYDGGCVDGDNALCEAGLSAECFFKLVALGTPFPRDRFGAWAGYKTDHDPRRRATSAGPYTSKLMTEKLHEAVTAKGIRIYDSLLVVKILTCGRDGILTSKVTQIIEDATATGAAAANGDATAAGKTTAGEEITDAGYLKPNEITGVLCLDLNAAQNGLEQYVAFSCKNIIFATGGPAGLYRDVVFPYGQHGANGLAFEAGAAGSNLTEWQYGLASLKPRWNVSGTYMQVLPKFVSTALDGSDELEFLKPYFNTEAEMLTNIFLKGYQWPFDSGKAAGGSSLIDLFVFNETRKGRRVFLDYRENTSGNAIDFTVLSPEARAYLEQARACFGTPYERLRHMNMPAVDFYRGHGVDLAVEPLEIALCAQHNNGGAAVDRWWQTRVIGLFAVGEAAATHGVRRPGGSALNAGQAGSLRAAQYIAARRTGGAADADEFILNAKTQIMNTLLGAKKYISTAKADELISAIDALRAKMSEAAGVIRNTGMLSETLDNIRRGYAELLINATGSESLPGNGGNIDADGNDAVRNTANDAAISYTLSNKSNIPGTLINYYTLRELVICQAVYLSAFIDYIDRGGKSRGGAIYTDAGGTRPHGGLPDIFAFTPDDGGFDNAVQEISYKGGGRCDATWRERRPLPAGDDFFENVWRDFREGRYID